MTTIIDTPRVKTNPLKALHEAGQAVWLDFVDRGFLAKGGLRQLVEEDGLTGVTSNPSIFEKAMGHGDAYDAGLKAFVEQNKGSVQDAYESQAIADIKAAAKDLRPVYDATKGQDGYVSLEVSPYLAHDTAGTIHEAHRLWAAVDEPNLMVKVPGTAEGVPAIRQLIEDGLNINVTLLFAMSAYQDVAHAFIEGLEARVAKGEPIDHIASVASFFVSRIDTQIDKKIDAAIKAGEHVEAMQALRGKVAIANAKLAYAWYQDLVGEDRWQALKVHGAMPQRLLWASTGVKDKAYPDTLYVDALIGRDTVNTIPPATMDAFRDHGTVAETLTADVDAARNVIRDAERLGLDLDGVTRALVEDAVRQFADAADALLGAVAAKRAQFLGEGLNAMSASLPDGLQQAVDARLKAATGEGWSRRLWQGDAALWTGKDEAQWLGWLPAGQGRQVDETALSRLRAEGKGFSDAVLLGMGGSSLGPEVLSLILGNTAGSPRLHVLDTTDPGQIAAVAGQIDPQDTLFIVSSKSGSTMEPELLRNYFYALSGQKGGHFVAVTDPGSKLEKTAADDGFAHVFHGDPAIGGRYSVLSVFGMVPAAAMGLDTGAFLAATAPMVASCGPDAPPLANPGLVLGAIIGEAAVAGHDKLTLSASTSLVRLGAWLEQLLAESTGKHGRGIVPVDLEPLGGLESYGQDRVFVHFALAGEVEAGQEARLAELEQAGHPVIRITLADKNLIGQEFFRWEVATAFAGSVIGIDPFDQPDVEEAKVATRKLVDAYEQKGAAEPDTVLAQNDDVAILAAQGQAEQTAGDEALVADPARLMADHFDALRPGDYAGFLAYVERNEADSAILAEIREAVRDACKVATVAGFGPRFLHSTGQAYKGGPNTGAFLVITRDPEPDLAIPGHRASFGAVQQAQARGDADVLCARGRRVLRLHLKSGGGGMEALKKAVLAAL